MSNSTIRFDRFMELALHDPLRGYYASRIPGVGRRGDFTTAPELSDAPARAIAAWARAAMRDTNCLNLIEIGPGEGTLAAAVLRRLPWLVRRKIRLYLVETSRPLEQLQRQLLGSRATWHHDIFAALRAARGRAVIFSNELVDAFPVRRFRLQDKTWHELHLELPGTPLPAESWLPACSLPDSSIFSRDFPQNQIIEVHESYHNWLASWMPLWRAGRMLTVDYGGPAEALYHRRPHGSLRAYFLRQRVEGQDVYANFGRQDITADVNFTDLIRWSAPWTHTRSLVPQADFLHPYIQPDHPQDRLLIDPAGAGHAFLVLDQQANG